MGGGHARRGEQEEREGIRRRKEDSDEAGIAVRGAGVSYTAKGAAREAGAVYMYEVARVHVHMCAVRMRARARLASANRPNRGARNSEERDRQAPMMERHAQQSTCKHSNVKGNVEPWRAGDTAVVW